LMTRALHGAAFLVVLAAVVAATRIESRPLRWVGVGEQPFDHRMGFRFLIVVVGLLLASLLVVTARRLSRPSKSPGLSVSISAADPEEPRIDSP
jgi:hypothetical protein